MLYSQHQQQQGTFSTRVTLWRGRALTRARVQAEESFKSLRRKLPKTKQEFNWQVSCVLRMLLLLLLLLLLLGCNHFSRTLFKVNLKEYGVMTDSRCQCQQQQQQQQHQ